MQRIVKTTTTTTDLSPAQRTAATARVVLTASLCGATEAAMHGSITRAMLSSVVLALSASLLAFAKRVD